MNTPFRLLCVLALVSAFPVAASDYQSPYSVEFTFSEVYNLALGIKPTGDVRQQALLTEVPGPGSRRTTPVTRIELPENLEDYGDTLLTADLLFIKNRDGEVSHVVLWVGGIGKSPDGLPLVLDSTGEGGTDSNGATIPSGIQLRPFRPGFWYASSASHALRIIP